MGPIAGRVKGTPHPGLDSWRGIGDTVIGMAFLRNRKAGATRGRPKRTTRSSKACLRLLQTHILVRPGEVEQRIQANRGLFDSRSHAVKRGRLENGCVHDALMHQPLHLM